MINEEAKPEQKATPEQEWPSVDLAFRTFVERSYEWMLNRYEAMDGRMQSFLAYVTTATLATPVFAGAAVEGIHFNSTWFYAAMGVFAVIIVLGALGRIWGEIALPSPQVLFEQWLEWPDWEFKKNAIYWAGEHFEHNRRVINTKGQVLLAMTVLFIVEILLLIAWIGSSDTQLVWRAPFALGGGGDGR